MSRAPSIDILSVVDAPLMAGQMNDIEAVMVTDTVGVIAFTMLTGFTYPFAEERSSLYALRFEVDPATETVTWGAPVLVEGYSHPSFMEGDTTRFVEGGNQRLRKIDATRALLFWQVSDDRSAAWNSGAQHFTANQLYIGHWGTHACVIDLTGGGLGVGEIIEFRDPDHDPIIDTWDGLNDDIVPPLYVNPPGDSVYEIVVLTPTKAMAFASLARSSGLGSLGVVGWQPITIAGTSLAQATPMTWAGESGGVQVSAAYGVSPTDAVVLSDSVNGINQYLRFADDGSVTRLSEEDTFYAVKASTQTPDGRVWYSDQGADPYPVHLVESSSSVPLTRLYEFYYGTSSSESPLGGQMAVNADTRIALFAWGFFRDTYVLLTAVMADPTWPRQYQIVSIDTDDAPEFFETRRYPVFAMAGTDKFILLTDARPSGGYLRPRVTFVRPVFPPAPPIVIGGWTIGEIGFGAPLPTP